LFRLEVIAAVVDLFGDQPYSSSHLPGNTFHLSEESSHLVLLRKRILRGDG
jgi:hypothetical protein